MNRRQFAVDMLTKGIIAAFVLAGMPACWFRNIYSQVNQYVPIALLAFDRIIAILVENSVPVSGLVNAVNMVKAALADIQTAVLEYHETHEHDKATLIQTVSVALKIASHRLAEFWGMLQIPNEQLARNVKTLIDVIISTLTGFVGQLSPGTPVAAQKFVSEPKARSLEEFKRDFNQALEQAGESKYRI